MNRRSIISRKQSLQILGNDLRIAALGKRAADLKGATTEKREAILAEIERDVRDEVRRRGKDSGHWDVIY